MGFAMEKDSQFTHHVLLPISRKLAGRIRGIATEKGVVTTHVFVDLAVAGLKAKGHHISPEDEAEMLKIGKRKIYPKKAAA